MTLIWKRCHSRYCDQNKILQRKRRQKPLEPANKAVSRDFLGDYFVNNQTPELGTRQFLASRLRDRGKSFRDKKKTMLKGVCHEIFDLQFF